MERRDFFKWGLGKVAGAAFKEAQEKAELAASQWIRPPYSISEFDFLIKCTRCDACIEACPHDVLFSLPAKYGLQAAGTPAMDLLNRGCHMCSDWPCVNTCEPDALVLPTPKAENANLEKDACEPAPPVLAAAAIETNACLPYLGPECGACADSCPVLGALVWDGTRPRIDPSYCTGCGLCREACIVSPKAVSIKSITAAQRSQVHARGAGQKGDKNMCDEA